MEGFKYQITVTVLLYKHKMNGNIEYSLVYFNSATKTVINYDKYDHGKSFQDILYRIENWINKGYDWIIESIDGEYVNISAYNPCTYIELPNGLKNLVKGLINIKTNYNKSFLWCHIRHLSLVKTHLGRIKKNIKALMILIMKEFNFGVSKKDYFKIETQNNICIDVFCYKNGLTYPVYALDKKFGNSMDLLLIASENKSHYMYIKDFSRFM